MTKYVEFLKAGQPTINPEDYEIQDHDQLDALQKEIQKTSKKLEELRESLQNKKEEIIFKKYEILPTKLYIKYSRTDSIYDWETGDPVDSSELNGVEGEDYLLQRSSSVSDSISYLKGFDYSKGALIYAHYNFRINSSKAKLTHTYTGQTAAQFTDYGGYGFSATLKQTKEFIKNFFGIEYNGNLRLDELAKAYKANKSFEIILNEAQPDMVDVLLKLELAETLPIHKILGLTRPMYNQLKDEGLLKSYYAIKSQGIKMPENENETYELLKRSRDMAEDFRFYRISSGVHYGVYSYYQRSNTSRLPITDDNDLGTAIAAEILTSYYDDESRVKFYYTLKKYYDYVFVQVVNQGYTELRTFTTELRDYIRMCRTEGIKPTLYSDYLRQTHDVTSRNHKVYVDEHQEDIFKNAYDGYPDKEKVNDQFYIIKPQKSDDLKHEGDNLNHCVGSYIKRVIDGTCLIFFLRKNPEESLVTLEVKDGRIVQVHGAHNRAPLTEEIEALSKWAEKHKLSYR